MAAHVLLESLFNYGLVATGSAALGENSGRLATRISNSTSRRVLGMSYSVRREVLWALVDLRSAHNHHLLKVANMFDRILRAEGT